MRSVFTTTTTTTKKKTVLVLFFPVLFSNTQQIFAPIYLFILNLVFAFEQMFTTCQSFIANGYGINALRFSPFLFWFYSLLQLKCSGFGNFVQSQKKNVHHFVTITITMRLKFYGPYFIAYLLRDLEIQLTCTVYTKSKSMYFVVVVIFFGCALTLNIRVQLCAAFDCLTMFKCWLLDGVNI